MPAKPSSHSSVAAAPAKRPQGDGVDHDVLAVLLEAAQSRLVAPPGPGRPVTGPLDGHGEAGEIVGITQVDPGIGEVDDDQHDPGRYRPAVAATPVGRAPR